MKKTTLKDWEDSIREEVPYVDLKPYSHTIISISLRGISEGYGLKAANNTIRKFGLSRLGWKTLPANSKKQHEKAKQNKR